MKIFYIAAILLFPGLAPKQVSGLQKSGSVLLKQTPKAETDNAFLKSSGISIGRLNRQQVQNLTLLGQVWGFIKYHHPAVAEGGFNMDAELLRAIPAVLKARNYAEASVTIEQWVDKFGKPNLCNNCTPFDGNNITQKPDYGEIFNLKVLKVSLVNKLKYILNNRFISKTGTHYYIDKAGNGNPLFKHEPAYSGMTYPDPGYRLLALFRYWNIIQYYFPYKKLIGEDWNKMLPKYIPQFVNAQNAYQYEMALLRIIANIHDTHANIWSEAKDITGNWGKYLRPFKAKFVENKLVVTGYYYDTLNIKSNLKVGDIITEINGERIDLLVKRYLPTTPASNYATQLRDLAKGRLFISQLKKMQFQVVRDGKGLSITQEAFEPADVKRHIASFVNPKKPGYIIMDKTIGYVYPASYSDKDLPAITAAFKNTKGIIVDMRCYPAQFMPFTFVPYIKSGNGSFVKLGAMDITHPGLFRLQPAITVPPTGEYKRKVVIIVNEESQSQAEYTTMAFQSSANVTVIGSTTAGADGDVSAIVLPGGVRTMISGLEVQYPDGRQTQRVGVKIDVVVKPTIAGIKAGRDELLEKAKAIIMQ